MIIIHLFCISNETRDAQASSNIMLPHKSLTHATNFSDICYQLIIYLQIKMNEAAAKA